jgi:type II secretory pathway component GspD/PulD (secretin)
MKPFFLILSLLLLQYSQAQPLANLLQPIPDALKINTHVVKREENITLEIKSPARILYKVHQLITVLDEAASDELKFMEFTDQNISLEDVAIKVYNAQGELINSYSKKK